MSNNELIFFCDCVDWNKRDVEALSDMIDNAISITRKTFLKHVCRGDLKTLEKQLGYDDHYKQGMTMTSDWCVSYCRSKLHGETVYYFCHSAIEYVFCSVTLAEKLEMEG